MAPRASTTKPAGGYPDKGVLTGTGSCRVWAPFLFPCLECTDDRPAENQTVPPHRAAGRRRRRRGRLPGPAHGRLGGRLRQAREEGSEDRLHPADRLRVGRHGLGAWSFDKKYGIKIVPSKEASWAGVRDKLVNGELDAAHVLYGLIYGVQMGIGGPKKDMAVLMNLNNNGQAITLSNKLDDKGAVDGASLAKLMDKREARVHVRADLPDRHARHVALLLAGGARHQPVQGRQDRSPCRRRRWWPTCASATWTASASASRGATARSCDGIGITARDHAGHLERPSGEDARHDRRVRQEDIRTPRAR